MIHFQDTSPSEGAIAFMHAGEEIGVKVGFEPHRSTTAIPQAGYDLSRQMQDLSAPLPYVLIVTGLFLFVVGLLPKKRR